MTREELNAAGDWAFPSGDGEYGGGPNHCPGMTLRDYFAAQALPSVISKCVPQECTADESMEQMFSRKAYAVAVAMLEARAAVSTTGEPNDRG